MIEMETLSANVYEMNLFVIVSEVNLIGHTKEWWVDTRATRHICSKMEFFTSYQSLNHGEKNFMGNSLTSKVEGKEMWF